MKHLLAILLTLPVAVTHAQHCDNSLLFKPGATLEFKTYQTYMILPRVKYQETTKLLLKVETVKDSNNKRYSYITKTGINPQNDTLRYEKQFILACDGQSFTIPIDLYLAERIYFSNHYEIQSPAALGDTGLYSSYTFNSDVALRFPISGSSQEIKLTGEALQGQFYRRYYDVLHTPGEPGNQLLNRKKESTTAASITYSNLRTGNRLSFEVPSGSYTCQLVRVAQTMQVDKAKHQLEQMVYYNHRLGIVRSEHYVNKKIYTMYTELVSVQE